MNIIIPMAGRGSRLRPHTLTVPKPLIPIAGKPIVQRLAEDLAEVYGGKIDNIAFIIGDFGAEVEKNLLAIADRLGAKGHICFQDEPLGTAHAIWQAEKWLEGEVIIAFADTLFRSDFVLEENNDGVIWVKTVANPESFGVVTVDESGYINGMVEKPKDFVSDLAIIGIYYIRSGAKLHSEIKHLLDNNIREKGEYQLTNALENMRLKGAKFVPGKVNDWMDCGNKDAVLDTTQKMLNYDNQALKKLVFSPIAPGTTIIPPCYIGDNVTLNNCTLGPNVSIGSNSVLTGSVITNSIIGENSEVAESTLINTMAGNHTQILNVKKVTNLDIGDYCRVIG